MIKFWRSFDCEINFQGRDLKIVKGEISRRRDRFNLSIRRFCTDKYIPRAFSLVYRQIKRLIIIIATWACNWNTMERTLLQQQW